MNWLSKNIRMSVFIFRKNVEIEELFSLTVGEFLIICPLSIIVNKAKLILKLNKSLG